MIAISAAGKKPRDLMDVHFARCRYFIFIDKKRMAAVENPFHKYEKDVAPQVIEWLEKLGATQIITGEVGPKASKILQEKKIQIILFDAEKIKIQDIRKKLNI